jgi:hypothetical protein
MMRKRNMLIAVLGCVIILGSTGTRLRGMEVSGGLFYGGSWALRDLTTKEYRSTPGLIEYDKAHLKSFWGSYFRLAGPRLGILIEYYQQSLREEYSYQINAISLPQLSYTDSRKILNVLVLAAEYQILPSSNKKWLPFIGAGIWIPFQFDLFHGLFTPGFVKNDVFGRLGIRWRPVKPLGVLAAMDYLVRNSILVFKSGLEIWF